MFDLVKRTATRTSNLTVIAFGAGFTALLVYALASELFARNSPTVLYGKACEKMKASEKVNTPKCGLCRLFIDGIILYSWLNTCAHR